MKCLIIIHIIKYTVFSKKEMHLLVGSQRKINITSIEK
jgi:hypothetical protein